MSQYFWCTINNKTIAQVDSLFGLLGDKGEFLSGIKWHTYDAAGDKVKHLGAYMIVDGGYHRWCSLVCPYKHQLEGTDMSKWSKNVESVRKDAECVFGILKKQF